MAKRKEESDRKARLDLHILIRDYQKGSSRRWVALSLEYSLQGTGNSLLEAYDELMPRLATWPLLEFKFADPSVWREFAIADDALDMFNVSPLYVREEVQSLYVRYYKYAEKAT